MNIKSSNILITGASEGIGEQIAYELAKENANLILVSRTAEKLKKVGAKTIELGAQSAHEFSVDLRNNNNNIE